MIERGITWFLEIGTQKIDIWLDNSKKAAQLLYLLLFYDQVWPKSPTAVAAENLQNVVIAVITQREMGQIFHAPATETKMQ